MQFTFLQDDIGIPANYRHMEGFGVHTYTLINKEGRVTYVKFHWQPTCGALLPLPAPMIIPAFSNATFLLSNATALLKKSACMHLFSQDDLSAPGPAQAGRCDVEGRRGRLLPRHVRRVCVVVKPQFVREVCGAAGVKNLLEDEAVVVGGSNHSHATQDLYDSIAAGDYPEWKLLIQVLASLDQDPHQLHFRPPQNAIDKALRAGSREEGLSCSSDVRRLMHATCTWQQGFA